MGWKVVESISKITCIVGDRWAEPTMACALKCYLRWNSLKMRPFVRDIATVIVELHVLPVEIGGGLDLVVFNRKAQ